MSNEGGPDGDAKEGPGEGIRLEDAGEVAVWSPISAVDGDDMSCKSSSSSLSCEASTLSADPGAMSSPSSPSMYRIHFFFRLKKTPNDNVLLMIGNNVIKK